MRTVLCISDSLGLPRPGVPYGDTWISILKNTIPHIDFIPLFRRNATTNILSEGCYAEFLTYYTPSAIILQLGICDCSPRYIRTTSLVYKLINRMPESLKKTFWVVYKKFVKRNPKRTDVSIDQFSANLNSYVKKCSEVGVEHLIIIKIAHPGSAMIKANPQIQQAINMYNAEYEQLALRYSFIEIIHPLHTGQNDLYVADGYHANALGNKLVADQLIPYFQ